MKKFISTFAAVLICGATLAQPAVAETDAIKPKSAYPEEVVAAVEKGFSSPLEPSEVALLKDNYPELAAVVPDLRAESITSTTNQKSQVSTRSTNGCTNAAGMQHTRTLLGFTFYKMHTNVRFCWSGNRVTSVTGLNTTFSNVDPMAEIGGVVESTQRPGANGYARHKYLVKNVVPWAGQISTQYPHNTFTMYPGGRFNHGHGV